MASARSCGPPHPGARTQRPGRHGGAAGSCLSFPGFTARPDSWTRTECGPGLTASSTAFSLWLTDIKRRSPEVTWRNRLWQSPTSCWWGRFRGERRCCGRGRGRGDLLYVTGALGGAAAGLDQLRSARVEWVSGKRHTRTALVAPHLWPQPRIAQGLWLRRRAAATAAIDLSDGLSTDLDHLCQESGVSAEIDAGVLPIHAGATLNQALHGGEDYELLFAARPNAVIPRSIAGVPVTKIGRIVKNRAGQPRVILLDSIGPATAGTPGMGALLLTNIRLHESC